MNDPIIVVENLCKRFGGFTAVDSLSFRIRTGEIVAFLGPNGAGKTTTLKMLTGLLPPTSGKMTIGGYDGTKERKKVKSLLGYMSQKFSLYPLLTAGENLEFFAGISDLPRKRVLLRRRELEERLQEAQRVVTVENLPPGIRQTVALTVSMVTDPPILFLDEPTSGVDPEARRRFWQEIYNLKGAGKTLIVSTHNLDEVDYADRMIMIHRGRLMLEGEPAELLSRSGYGTIDELFQKTIADHEKNESRDR